MDRNVHIGKVGWGAVAIVVAVLVAAGLAALFQRGAQPSPQGRQVESSPQDLRAFLRDKRARLGGYGWVDRDAGVIHVPIERAMQRMVEEQR